MIKLVTLVLICGVSDVLATAKDGKGGAAKDGTKGKDAGKGGTKPTKPTPPPRKVPDKCNRGKIIGDIEKCLKAVNPPGDQTKIDKCASDAKTAATADCAKDIDKVIEGARLKAAFHGYNTCIAKGTAQADCETAWKKVSGKTAMPAKQGNAAQQKNNADYMKRKGAKDNAQDKMKDCISKLSKTATAADMKACRDLVFADYKASLTKKPSDAILNKAVRDSAKLAAGKAYTDCMNAAADQAAKDKCKDDTAVKQSVATALGKDLSKITKDDVKRAAKQSAQKDMTDALETCMQAAGTDQTARDLCKKNTDLKSYIANADGTDKTTVKDSRVKQFLKQGQQNKVLDALKACTIDKTSAATTKASIEACKAEAKRVLADNGAAKATDFSVAKSKKKASARDVKDIMDTCMTDAAGDKDKIKACISAKEEALTAANYGQKPSKKYMKDVDRMAAKDATKDVCSASDTDTQCVDKLKGPVARALGKTAADIKTVDVKRYKHKGARDAGAAAAVACKEASDEASNAVCDDPYDKFLAGAGKTAPTDDGKKNTEKKAFYAKIAKEEMAKARRECFDPAKTSAERKTCLTEAKAEADGLFDHLFKDTITDADKKAKRKERAKTMADVLAIGEDYELCMDAAAADPATEAAEKQKCDDALQTMRTDANVTQTKKEILTIVKAKTIRDQKASCKLTDKAEMKECLAAAKELAKKLGMEPREFRIFKKFGDLQAGAEQWSASKDAGLDDAKCDTAAKEKYNELRGHKSDSPVAADKVDKMRKIGKALNEGKTVKTKHLPEVDVSSVTDGTACDSTVETKFVDKVKTGAGGGKNAKSKGCSLENEAAIYTARVSMPKTATDADFKKTSEDIQTAIDKASLRRLSGRERHLASVTEAYAGQAVTQCAEDDTSCAEGSFATTTQASGGTTTVKGTLTLTTDNCANLQTTDGKAGIAEGIAAVAGAQASSTSVTVACSRRLEDRRLSTQTASIGYTITVPAGSTVTAATMKSNLAGASASTFQTKILEKLTAKGVTASVTVTNVGTVTSTKNEASMACPSPVRGGFIAIFSLLVSIAARNHM